ncbi:signal recognition particle-docking protein FtsY [Beijerinckia sp. L45]|uniref:signal recognition particle-docking protein FtsY n=1 Tax=Beijerinckia sp. L45 TaxID=1641855 RepID=UPI00131ADE16|nr:signal recognition particle-docking protein FtsY [Beijerinckia sp. L45]
MASDKTESSEKPTFFGRLFGRKDRPGDTPEVAAEAPSVAPLEPPSAQPEAEPDLPTEASVSDAVLDALAAGSGGEFNLEPPDIAPAGPLAPAEAANEKRSWWTRLKEGLTRSSSALGTGITDIFTKRKLDDAMLDELEEVLIRSDLGVATATRISQAVGKGRYDRQVSPDDVKTILATEVERVLSPLAVPIAIEAGKKPFVILVVGVNGSGKTTTIGKLAAKFTGEGKRVTLAAGDTFRAAAIAQLRIWGERFGCTVIARDQGSDAASLAYEAIVEARTGDADILLMDTAGRLQNRTELMAELEKIIRVMKKVDASAPHAVLLVLDATVGQNAMNQVEIFGKVAGVTGLVMTKLDGTARGGILVAIADKFKLPIHFIGVGETAEDLEPFSARDFAEAIAGVERADAA